MYFRTGLVPRFLIKNVPQRTGKNTWGRFYWLGMVLFVNAFCFAGPTDTIDATVVSSTSLNETLPYELFKGKTWEANPEAKFVRLDILLDKPVVLGGLEIEFENSMNRNVSIYLNDLDKTFFVSPINSKILLEINYPKAVTSVKFNFGDTNAIAVKSIVLKNKEKHPFFIRTSRVIEGSAKASSTLKPTRFYDILKIFDSKLENGWSSNKQESGDTLEFSFAKPQTITALKIWNGYLRSELHYYANSRAKTLKLEDKKGYSQTIKLLDTMGSQEIQLPRKFAGDYLKVIILDSYAGKTYKDLVISELRFFDGNSYFLVNPLKALKTIISYNQSQFTKAGIQSLLDGEAQLNKAGYLRFRFRSDGSLYCEGAIDNEFKSKGYFIVGNYDILKASEDSVDLRLFGYIVTNDGTATDSQEEGRGDCGGGGYSYVYKNASKRIFTEFITIKQSESADYFTFVNTGKNHNLNFTQEDFIIY